jgi:hypothetical protein
VNTPTPLPQALDHRTFLQQYVLAMAEGREYGTPEIRIREAHEAWDQIEKAVEAELDAADERFLEAVLKQPGVFRASEKLPKVGLPPAIADRLVRVIAKRGRSWGYSEALDINPAKHLCWKELD